MEKDLKALKEIEKKLMDGDTEDVLKIIREWIRQIESIKKRWG